MLKRYIEDLASHAFSERSGLFVDNVTKRVMNTINERTDAICSNTGKRIQEIADQYNAILNDARNEAKSKIEEAYREGVRDGYGRGFSEAKSNEVKAS